MADEIDRDAPRLAQLAELFEMIASRPRLAILQGLLDGRAMTDVADDLGVSRSAIQGHLDVLVARRFVYRPETGDAPYKLTPLGVFFAVFVRENADLLLDVLDRIEETEDVVEDELADVPVSAETRERMVAEETYDRVEGDVVDLLADVSVDSDAADSESGT